MGAAKGGKTSAKKVIKSPGRKPISFKPGGLHTSTGTPAGQKIPPAKMQAALSGQLGPKAKKQALFAKDVLGASPAKAGKSSTRKK